MDLVILLLTSLSGFLKLASAAYVLPQSVNEEKIRTFWTNLASQELTESLAVAPIAREAKNVILFVGDGMGISTVTAARIRAGQKMNRNGEDYYLAFEKFPYVGLSKTYSVDHQIADSAATATAYLCGVKANSYTVGVNGKASFSDCSSFTPAMEVTSILDWSRAAGKSTGVVTNTRVTHASPAAAYAHSVNREWEGSVPKEQRGCMDIAQQLVNNNADINVVMGGGRMQFLPYNYSEYDPGLKKFIRGQRTDSLDLIKKWKQYQEFKQRRYKYVTNATDFYSISLRSIDYLLGLFNANHMKYEGERLNQPDPEPSLASMTEAAIQIMSKNSNGYFLFVEGGQIDLGHHEGKADRALVETMAFSRAVERAVSLTSEQDTLIVITADHSHTMVIAGYPGRGHDIRGLSEDAHNQPVLADDHLPYTTLLYGSGPGGQIPGKRQDPEADYYMDPDYLQQAVVSMDTETHGGEDVAIYARGPMSHLFHGVHEQTYIAHVMAYASCVGDFRNMCARSGSNPLS